MKKKINGIASLLVVPLVITSMRFPVEAAPAKTLDDKVFRATLLLEELLQEEYEKTIEETENRIEENGWDYTLTMDSFYNNQNPYSDMDYEDVIATLCTILDVSEKNTVLNVDFLGTSYDELMVEQTVPEKVARYKYDEESDSYLMDGIRYVTEDGDYPVYVTEDGTHFKEDETIHITCDVENVSYGSIVFTPATRESMLEDVGLDVEAYNTEIDERIHKIQMAGVSNQGLLQSIFVQTQNLNILSEDALAQYLAVSEELTGNRKIIIDTAAGLVGRVPYQWGGKPSGPGYDCSWYSYNENGEQKGLDCSGFVTWTLMTAGYSSQTYSKVLSTATIMEQCDRIEASELQPGDLGLLNDGSSINHVGIYLGNGYYIHCNGSDNTVSIDQSTFYLYYRIPNVEKESIAPYQEVTTCGIEYTQADLELIAKTVWHEARGQGTNGWIAVAEVIKNRIQSPSFPDTAYEVIYAQNQFEKNEEIEYMEPSEAEIQIVAMVLRGELSILGNQNVLFFRNPGDDGDANWGKLPFYKRINDHVFYTAA